MAPPAGGVERIERNMPATTGRDGDGLLRALPHTALFVLLTAGPLAVPDAIFLAFGVNEPARPARGVRWSWPSRKHSCWEICPFRRARTPRGCLPGTPS